MGYKSALAVMLGAMLAFGGVLYTTWPASQAKRSWQDCRAAARIEAITNILPAGVYAARIADCDADYRDAE